MRSLKFIFILFLGVIFSLPAFAQRNKKELSEQQRNEFDKHFFSGMKEKMTSNFEEACVEFNQSILIDPSNANVHYQMAGALLALKRIDQAMEEAKRACVLDPKNDWYTKFAIELYKKQKLYEEAVKLCQRAYKEKQDPHYLYELSGLYILLGKTNKAIAALDEVEKKTGVSEQLCRQKEDLYLSKNDLKGAIKEVEKLCKFFPEQTQYKGLLADLLIGSNRQEEGLKIYRDIQAKDPGNGFAAFSLADYYRIKRDTNQYWEQLKIGMNSSIDYKLKVQVLSKLITEDFFGYSHRNKCKELADIFIQANPTAPEPLLLKGDLFLQDRNMELARTYYLQAGKMPEAGEMVWDQIIFCDQQLQRMDWMKEDGLMMIQLFPNNSNSYLYYSIACRQLQEYTQAMDAAQKGLQFAENENSLIQLLSNLGDMAHYAGNSVLSDSSYEAVLSMDPTNAMALNNYAYFLSLRKLDLDKAENMSKRSIELDPENPSNLDTYGWILYQKGNYEQAKIQIEKSLRLSPENAEVTEHLGDICFRLNLNQEAINYWKKAKSLGSNSKELEIKILQNKLP